MQAKLGGKRTGSASIRELEEKRKSLRRTGSIREGGRTAAGGEGGARKPAAYRLSYMGRGPYHLMIPSLAL